MKKISLFLISSLFSITVIAQTTPNASTAAPQAKPATVSKTSSTTTRISKTIKKKTVAGKTTTTHHVTPVKKSATPAPVKSTQGNK